MRKRDLAQVTWQRLVFAFAVGLAGGAFGGLMRPARRSHRSRLVTRGQEG